MSTPLRITAGLLLPAILSSTLHASETVRWADLPKEVGKGRVLFDGQEDREYMIITNTGKTYRDRTLLFKPSGVRFFEPTPFIPREQVIEIRIRHHVSWGEAFFVPGGMVADIFEHHKGLDYVTPFDLLLIPVSVVVDLAAAPFVAAIESGRRLVPAKVIKVAP
ncbi:MAG TPA: hypothetical protein VN841_09840 [Bryobacteraceae bacterium]|nr:hypothetical protein [Bryobacteraceae bacterium]